MLVDPGLYLSFSYLFWEETWGKMQGFENALSWCQTRQWFPCEDGDNTPLEQTSLQLLWFHGVCWKQLEIPAALHIQHKAKTECFSTGGGKQKAKYIACVHTYDDNTFVLCCLARCPLSSLTVNLLFYFIFCSFKLDSFNQVSKRFEEYHLSTCKSSISSSLKPDTGSRL